MRKNLGKSIFSWIVIFILALSFHSFATEKATSSDSSSSAIFSCEEVVGNSAQSAKELFSSIQPQTANVNAPTLSDVILSYKNERLEFSGTFSYNGESIPINTSGDIYKNEKTANSGISENLVLVDMDDINDWHFVQFRLDKNNSYILIVLQNMSNYELVQFIVAIDEENFETFYNLHDNSISDEELENKIVELYSVAQNVLNRETPNTDQQEFAIQDSFNPNENKTLVEKKDSYSGWKKLLDDLDTKDTVKASDYDIDLNLLSGNGWQYGGEFDEDLPLSYNVAAYSYENGPDEYLTQFQIGYIVIQKSQEDHPNDWRLSISVDYSYTGGHIIAYYPLLDEIRILYRQTGLTYDSFDWSVGELDLQDSFFIDRLVSGTCESSGGSPILGALALTKYGSIISDIWSLLSNYEAADLDDLKTFPLSRAGQEEIFSGKILKGVAASIGDGSFTKPGHHLLLKGTVLIPKPHNEINWWYRYKFTCKTII